MPSSSATHRSPTRGLVIATLAVLGLGLGGTLLDRGLIATPAWERLGATEWAAYSHHADLGNGLIIYPIVAILPTVLAIAAALSQRLDRAPQRSAGPPIYLTALCMLGVIATTLIAAPIMLGIDDRHDATSLRQAFEQFALWGIYVRGSFLAAAFLSSLWALSVLAAKPTAAQPDTHALPRSTSGARTRSPGE